MDLGNFNIKDLFSNSALTDFVNEFIKELSDYLHNNKTDKENNMKVENL